MKQSKHTKRQIQEAIEHWQGKLDEMRDQDDEPIFISFIEGQWQCEEIKGHDFESVFKKAKRLNRPIQATIDDQDVIIYNPIA